MGSKNGNYGSGQQTFGARRERARMRDLIKEAAASLKHIAGIEK